MKNVKTGDRIRLLSMPDDPDPIPAGSKGVVIDVTDGPLAQIMVEWIGINRTLALIPDVDRFEIIKSAKGEEEECQ